MAFLCFHGLYAVHIFNSAVGDSVAGRRAQERLLHLGGQQLAILGQEFVQTAAAGFYLGYLLSALSLIICGLVSLHKLLLCGGLVCAIFFALGNGSAEGCYALFLLAHAVTSFTYV